jgi:hypothetical protein
MFEKGQSGNPGGRPKEKPWRDALTIAIKDGDGLRLRRIADAVVTLAETGDMQAIKEIGDRLDGKPAQQTIVTGDEDGGAVNIIQRIERHIVDPKSSDT